MRHVIRGGSVTSRRADRTRIVALIATFFLLMAGMLVSAAPGLMSASATSGSSNTHSGGDDNNGGGNDDGHHNGGDDESECHSHDGDDDSGNDDSSDDHSGDDQSGDDHSGDDHSGDDHSSDDHSSDDHSSDDQSGDHSSDDQSGDHSSDDQSGDHSSDDQSGDHSSDDQSGDHSSDDQSGDHSSDDQSGDHSSDDQSGDNSNVSVESATVQGTDSGTSDSSGGTDDGKGSGSDDSHSNGTDDGHDDGSGTGHDDGSDDGHDDGSGSGNHDGNDDGHDDGSDDGHHDGHDDGDDDGDDDGNCATTATLTLNKILINDNDGTAELADFILVATSSVGNVAVISGADPSDDPTAGISATVPVSESYVLSESGPDGYDASGWTCSAGTLAGDTLTLAAGDVANCTITNDDTPPAPAPATITVDKMLPPPTWGGTLGAGDFQLQIDGANVTQSEPHEVTPGSHTISEQARPGYVLEGIVCIDNVTEAQLSTDGTVTVAAGQDVQCIVGNMEDPATLTLTKFVDNTNGGNAVSSDFQLLIDDESADQNTALPQVAAVPHTIGEVPMAGYKLVGIDCSDDDTQLPVVYNAGITLVLGQHVTCKVTNVSDPVNLVITKSDNGATQVAGGAAFDYTITVDNLGPRDATTGDLVTVTDQLPVGLQFVSYPANCTAVGQVLTCNLSPADLQVADPAVVITVTVKAPADADAGTYTNMAYVDTADDPACVGTGCAPVCGASNNVACEDTDVTRFATGITITKVDNVDGPIAPGTTYSYFVTVGNPGPSTFPAGNLTMSDDLPAGLNLVSVSGASPWTCNNADPVLCTYNEVLWPGATTTIVTITVQLDPNFSGTSIINLATATAVVTGSLSSALAVPPDPIVVTATDDETTTIVRTADLAIDKSVSQATATNGDQFNWILDITNHGPDLATNVVVTDTIPAAFEVIGTFPTAGLACTNSANSVQCTAASLANGATVRAVVQVRVAASAAPGAVTNTGTVTASSTDPNTANNSDSASITVTGAGSLAPVPPATPPASGSGAVALPRTGNGSLAAPLTLGCVLLVGGIFSLVIARRRRTATA